MRVCSPNCRNPKCVTIANGLCLPVPWDLLWILAILLLALGMFPCPIKLSLNKTMQSEPLIIYLCTYIPAGWIYFHILIAQEKGGYVQIEMPQYRESRDSSRESKFRDSRDNSRENRGKDRGRGNTPFEMINQS